MKQIITLFLLITVLSSSTCSKEDTIVSVNCENLINDPLDPGEDANIYIASGFTPNGDGINDEFMIFFKNIASAKTTIYDANSNIVFSTENMYEYWKPANNVIGSTYYYRVEGLTASGKRIGKCGEVYPLNCFPSNGHYIFPDQMSGLYEFSNPTADTYCP